MSFLTFSFPYHAEDAVELLNLGGGIVNHPEFRMRFRNRKIQAKYGKHPDFKPPSGDMAGKILYLAEVVYGMAIPPEFCDDDGTPSVFKVQNFRKSIGRRGASVMTGAKITQG